MEKIKNIRPTHQLILALLLFIATVFASRGEEILAWEIALFEFIYSLPSSLHLLFYLITQAGSIYALGFLFVYFFYQKKYHIGVRLMLTGTLAYLMAGVAKDLWGRGRPSEYIPDIVNLDYVVRGPGFPSGHTAFAVAIAFTLGHYLPKKYHWIVITWIILVGLSRLYLGIHFPLDIIGGFAIGWMAYAIFMHVRLRNTVKTKKVR